MSLIKWLKKVNNILCEMFAPSVVVYTPKREERAKKPRIRFNDCTILYTMPSTPHMQEWILANSKNGWRREFNIDLAAP